MGKKRKASEAHQDTREPATNGHVKPIQKKKRTNAENSAPRPRHGMKIELRPDWYAVELPPIAPLESVNQPPKHTVQALKDYAIELLDAENKLAATTVFQDSSHKFMSTMAESGTLEDKISALTLGVQESPIHTLKDFKSLLGLCRKKSRTHALMALAAVKDMLGQGNVLPSDRKLRWFGKQPGLLHALQGKAAQWQTGQPLPDQLQDVHLLSWAFEDWLKQSYFEILQILEACCGDEIDYVRTRAMTYIWELLKEKPEQEENLLRLLVNKLGDNGKKVASRASYLLLQLLETHPNMKETVVISIEADAFRSGQNSHAKYYAMITLNQIVLSGKEKQLAKKLLDVYFAAFKLLLKNDEMKRKNPTMPPNQQKLNRKAIARQKAEQEKNESEDQMHERMIAQILTGIRRAFPFADPNHESFEAHLNALYRLTHSSNLNTAIQALILIQQISSSKEVTADRFYQTLYDSLLDPRLIKSSKQALYLNLLYSSLKADLDIKRVQAFVKRILQALTLHEPPFVCSALYLVAELQKAFPSIKSMLSEPEQLDDEEEHFRDVPSDTEEPSTPAATSVDMAKLYDPRKRNPLFANADRSCLWELLPLQAHYHPSVAMFASRLLLGEKMPEKPDPTLHTLMHFLDRFVYKNAKTSGAKPRGVSIMQPLAGNAAADLLIKDRSGAAKELPLNSEAFWTKKIEEVGADEVFFHRYFNQSTKKAKKEKKDKMQAGSDDGDVSVDLDGGEDEEDEIWEALKSSKPDIEGRVDEEGFSDMEDFSMSDDGSDDGSDGGVELNLDSDESGSAVDVGAAEEIDVDAGADIDGEAPADEDDELDDFPDFSEDDVVGSDEDVPPHLQIPAEDDKADGKKSKRKKLKQLPVFASAEDYAQLIGDDEEDY